MSRTAKLISYQWLLALLSGLPLALDAEQLTPPEIEIVQWFDGLGFPDVSKAKVVRVAFAGYPLNDEPAVNEFILAFLLDENEDRFTVFTPSLETQTYQKKPDTIPGYSKITFEFADLRKEATAEIKRLNAPPKSEEDRFRRMYQKLSESCPGR